MKKRAFSLIELSIVLVILGLLTGGILAGKSLIRASEIRSVATAYQSYFTAMQSFRDKYMAIPGDMINATSFWGAMGACPGSYASPAIGTATCNGTGDGKVTDEELGTGIQNSLEQYRFWQHMANAGLIEGRFTGVNGAGATADAVPGENIPVGKMNEGYNFLSTGNYAGSTSQYATNYGSRFVVGKYSISGYGMARTAFLKPEEAWALDTKLDDGRPGRGKLMVYGLNSCTDSSSNTNFDANYKFTNTSIDCSLIFRNQL